jgi:hypothetical protein
MSLAKPGAGFNEEILLKGFRGGLTYLRLRRLLKK